MGFFGFILFLIGAVLIGAVYVLTKDARSVADRQNTAALRGVHNPEDAVLVEPEDIILPSWSKLAGSLLVTLGIGGMMFSHVMFYAHPGYVYHVRTALGTETVVTSIGYHPYFFGRYNAWKQAMTVQSSKYSADGEGDITAESDQSTASAKLPPTEMIFLDQVDGKMSTTVRFSIPTDKETFLLMAHEYRNPENLLRTALVPAVLETVQSTGSLMSADEYYSGGRTSFNADFERQMSTGIFLVERNEILVPDPSAARTSANAAKSASGEAQDTEEIMIIKFVVERRQDENGVDMLKPQSFLAWGITVTDARVTDLKPNAKFTERMQLKQKASAERAIAREERTKEEQQRLLAITRGEREVAERQAEAKVVQIALTTQAETKKQLALTDASMRKEQAQINAETAKIVLGRDKTKAQSVRVLAQAEAYRKSAVMKADNALAQKLAAEIEIQKVWAQAFAQRKVPTTVFGGGGSGNSMASASTGSDGEVKNFMQMLTLDAANRLNYSRSIASAD